VALLDEIERRRTAIDAAVLQVDEANLPGSPQDGAWAAEVINHVLGGVAYGTERALHLCFGNYGGQTIQLHVHDLGEHVRFEGAILATGSRPRKLPGQDDLPDVVVLRSVDDSLDLRQRIGFGRAFGRLAVDQYHLDCGRRVLERTGFGKLEVNQQ
jgi:hypothetical protein